MADSDSLYHRLFSHPRMVEELVREFVPELLTEGLDFQTLQQVNPKFHGRLGKAWKPRTSDVIWRLPTRQGAELYLVIEFQSKEDRWMAVRTQVYQGLLWEQIIDEKQLKSGARLPPLLLLVLYNGAPRWKAAADIRNLITLAPDSVLWSWQPQARYYLLDIGTFAKDDLAQRSTLVALLFRLEQRHLSEQETLELLHRVIGWFGRHEGHERLRELFAELVRKPLAILGATVSGDLLEMTVKSNFYQNVANWKRKLLAEGETRGLVKGKAEGKEEGKAEGKADALVCLLTDRFGDVPPSLDKRIRDAELPTLDRWFKRAIAAPDLPSVFSPPQ